MPRILSFVWGAMNNRTPYGVASEPWVESKNQAEGQTSLESFSSYPSSTFEK
jgi:hypothetical protein